MSSPSEFYNKLSATEPSFIADLEAVQTLEEPAVTAMTQGEREEEMQLQAALLESMPQQTDASRKVSDQTDALEVQHNIMLGADEPTPPKGASRGSGW